MTSESTSKKGKKGKKAASGNDTSTAASRASSAKKKKKKTDSGDEKELAPGPPSKRDVTKSPKARGKSPRGRGKQLAPNTSPRHDRTNSPRARAKQPASGSPRRGSAAGNTAQPPGSPRSRRASLTSNASNGQDRNRGNKRQSRSPGPGRRQSSPGPGRGRAGRGRPPNQGRGRGAPPGQGRGRGIFMRQNQSSGRTQTPPAQTSSRAQSMMHLHGRGRGRGRGGQAMRPHSATGLAGSQKQTRGSAPSHLHNDWVQPPQQERAQSSTSMKVTPEDNEPRNSFTYQALSRPAAMLMRGNSQKKEQNDRSEAPVERNLIVNLLPSQFFGRKSIDEESSQHSDVMPSTKSRASRFTSGKSVLTYDMEEFDGEPGWKKFLRHIHILSPTPNEKPIKKRIRQLVWLALFLDFVAAVVSIATYSGNLTVCCEKPILNIIMGGNFEHWGTVIRVTITLYIILILVEIMPVVREGLPLNLINPFIGFGITFALFFDDSIVEAAAMWVIEAGAVLCEIIVYCLKVRMYRQRNERLNDATKSLHDIKSTKRMMKQNTSVKSGYSDDDSYASGDSLGEYFQDEPEPGGTLKSVNVSGMRESRLLRERRILRQTQAVEIRHLRYHLFGVGVNTGLMFISLLLIVCIARSGGLCIKNFERPNIFKMGQLQKCNLCVGEPLPCEVCLDGAQHCYYPYAFNTNKQ